MEEANAVEAIAGRMRTDDAYCLDSPLPMVQAEQSDEMKALIKQMQTLCLQYVEATDKHEQAAPLKCKELLLEATDFAVNSFALAHFLRRGCLDPPRQVIR